MTLGRRIRRAIALGAEDGPRGAVAEQRGGDDIALRGIGAAERGRAQLDRQEQHAGLRPGARHGGGAGEAGNAARASQAENWKALDVSPEPHSLDQQGVERRHRDSGGRDRHHRIHVVRPQARAGEARARDLLCQGNRVLGEDTGAFRPAVGFAHPRERHAGAPARDAGVGERGAQALEALGLARKHAGGERLHLALRQFAFGDRGGEREKADRRRRARR